MSITLGDAIVYLVSDDSELKAGLARAEGLTGGFASTMAGSFQVAMGQLMAQAVTGLVTAVGDGVQAMGGFFASGVEGAISLDAQLAGIAAKMGATKDEVLPLKDLIFSLSLDPNLVVNTTQAAEAIEMLAGNGAKMSDIVGGLAASTVALANATGNDFGLAAEVATSAMDLFGLKAADTQKAFDGLVGVTTATKFGINDMKLALSQSGAVFAGMGGDIKDFSTVIAGTATSFASGSDAGTSFKATLQRMANPTAEVKAEMAKLGISLFDSTGQMRPMEEVIGQLNQALYGQVTVTQQVGGATKEQAKAAEDAAKKIPDLTYKITEQKEQLQFLSNQLFETRKWYAEGSDEVLKAKDKYDDMAKAIADNEAKLGTYNGALETVAGSHATTTTSTKTLTEAERAHSATVIGGADGMRMMLAMGKMTAEQYRALTEDVNKSGLAFATAATQVDSVQGAFDIFWGVIEAVQIQLGDALLPLIRQMTEVFTVFASVAAPLVVGSFQDIASNITSFMQMVLPAVGELNQAFKDGGIDGMLKLVGDNILGLLIPMGDARDGFAEMNATLNDSRTAIAAVIGLPLTNFLADIANAFKSGGIDGVLQELSNKITTGIPALIASMGQSLLDGASTLLSYTTQLLQSIPQALANFAPDADSAQQLGASLAQAILSAFGLAVSSAESVSSPLGEFFKALGAAAMSMSGVLFEVATNVASGFLSALQERFTTIDVSGIFGGLMGVLGGGAIASAFASLSASITPMLPILTSIGAGFTSFMAILAPLTTLIGASLAPAIAFIVAEAAAMGATFSIMFGSFASGLPFVSSISAAFTWLITAITPLATFLAPITAALGSVGLGFAALINPITLAGVAIIGLGALWGTNFEQMNGLAKQVFDYLLPTFENLKQGFNGFIAALTPAMPSIMQLFDTFIAAIPSMQVMSGVVIGGLVVAIGTLGNVLAAILPSLGQVISGLVTGLSGALSGAIQFVDGAVQMIKGLLAGDLDGARVGALNVLTGLVSGVEAIFSGLAVIAVGLITGLAEGIMAAMPDLGAALESMASYIIETAMSLLGVASPSTVFADIGLNLIEGLIEGISGAADTAYSAIEELVTTLIDTTLSIIESGADSLAGAWVSAWGIVAESTSGAIDGVIEFLNQLVDDSIELIGSVMDTIGGLWDSGWSTMSDFVDTTIGTITGFIDTFTGDSEDVIDGFMGTIGGLWDVGWSTMYDSVDGMTVSIYDTVEEFKDDAIEIWNELTLGMTDAWDIAWGIIDEALASAVETIGGAIDGVALSIGTIWDGLGTSLSTIWGAAWEAIEGVMSNASGAISGLMGGAQATLSSIWQTLSDGLNTVWVTAWTAIQSFGESAWLAIGTGVDTLSSGLQTVWETMSGVVSTVWETAWSTIGATYERVSSAIKAGIESLRDGVTTAMSSTTETISNMWNTVWETAGKATTNGKNNIISLVSDFLIGARQKFDDFRDKWVDAGKMMMSGVMDGLELMRDDFIDMFEELAWAALRRVKEVLGMQSPSTVFRDEVGVQMVAGMSEGMEQESGSMFDTIGNIAGGAVDAAVRGISGARDAIGGIFGGAFGEYISNNMTGQIQQATETAAINMEGVIAGLRQSADLNYIANTNKKASWDNVKSAVRSETADAIKLLNEQYQQMLSSGMDPEDALAKYNEAAKQAQSIIETAALKNTNIAHGGQNGGVSGIFGEIGTEINKAIEAAKVMKDNQLGLRDVFDFSLGSVEEELKVNLDSILNQAKTTVGNLSATYDNWNKSDGSPEKILSDMGDAAIKGITDGSKEMVNQTKSLLAAGMSPQEAMAKYVEMTNQAYSLLSNDTLVKNLPDTVREGKQVLSEAYKDILDTLDSQFIGGTNAKLKQAGNLFKQGLADGIDASTLVSVFNDQMTAIKKTTEDAFIQGMPGTLSKANDLMDTQYRTMKNDLEKGLVANMKESTKKAGETLTEGLKNGLDPAQLIAEYKATLDDLQSTLNNTDLLTLVPDAVNTAYDSVNDASDKLLGSIQKDFVGGVKSGLGTAESELKKGFANMTDPAQAQGFINAYLASVKDIKETFKGGVASMIPDALTEAQGLTNASAEKMAGDISKNFIKASKDKFKDMNEELKKSLEKGIDPTTIMMNFRESAAEINEGMYNARSAIANGLGQIVPKDLAGMDIVPELDKAKADIEKALTTNIKNKLGDAASTMKEGVKKGLDLTELVASYRQSAEELRKQTSGTEFGKATGAAVEAQLKSTKDYIENEFGKQVKDDIKGITTSLKNGLTLGDSPAKALADYQRELAKVNGFIGSELGKSMPEAMNEANKAVTDNYEDIFSAIGKQAKSALSEAKAAYKFDLSEGLITPKAARAKYDAVFNQMSAVINDELGKNAPLAVKAAKDELDDSLNDINELLKKNIVTQIKDTLSDGAKAFKDGLKDGYKTPQQLFDQWKAQKAAAKEMLKDLDVNSKAYAESSQKIADSSNDMLSMLRNNLVAGVKERMGTLKDDLKENMDFGGTVAEALTQLNSQSQALKDEFANGLGGQVPGAIEAANAQIEVQKTALLKNLGGKFVGELKDAIKNETTAYKEALEQGIDPTQALGAFNASISTVMAGMTTQLTEATPNLARMANGLVAAAQTELAKLGGGDIGTQTTTAIGEGLSQAVTTASQGVQGAVESIAANVTPVVTTIAGALQESLPEVVSQGDLLIVEVNRIGAALLATGKEILLQINTTLTTETVNIKLVATDYGLSIGAGIAEGIANGSQGIYDNLSLITTRVNSDMASVNATIASAQANSNAALAAVGQAAQQMITNANNAVTTTNNNNNIVINNPVPQPAAMDLMMIRNMSDR